MFEKVVGRLLRITHCKENGGKTPGYTYTTYGKLNQNKHKKANFGSFRLLLFQDLIGHTDVFYIKVPNEVNNIIWNKCLDVRDSGQVSIGAIFAFLGPSASDEVYCNDIKILEPNGSAILMQEPASDQITPFWGSEPSANETVSFHQIATIEIGNVYVANTHCVGFFCDRQNLEENKKNGNVCPCYSSGNANHARLVLQFDLEVTTDTGKTFLVKKFSSHKFTQYFIRKPFESHTTFNTFDASDAFVKMCDSIFQIFNYANARDKFTVIGWSKRGEINDQSAIGEDQKVVATEVTNHVTTILLNDFNDTDYKKTIEQFKYDNSAL